MKLRILAAVVLVPVLLAVLLVAPPILLAILVGVICAIGAYELLYGTGLVKHPRLFSYSALMAFCVPIWCYFGMSGLAARLGIFIFTALLFMEILLSKGKLRLEKVAICYIAGLLIPYLLSTLVRLMGDGSERYVILLPFILAFMADTGAYFIGCRFGKHKLSPVISPKKSVEGLVGGIFFDIAGMFIFCLIMSLAFGKNVNYLYAFTYGVVGALAGTFGDLSFSAIKRQAGIKDYGNLIPGHGGVLDRFDSVIIVAPLTELLLLLMPVLE
ncbi:MAG: phosphatidate cytidylyltransferase [Ruminococcaceae bacterium]|nr:phosphatidate cytidylyltransferase [Oscillospiraceae bacterium]